ncbi:12802_t:CDS:1 [Ambispora gerdemannii]|uniref:12802_t:CDS:1 n=1 Tax=Ambispora gerdemannii TaxID=144530 RepID=A0A9N9GV70_9GLOM|nr:12802_t:CDS:1 [Ambispora gerdemannii]
MKIIKPTSNSRRNTILLNYREELTHRPPATPRQLLRIRKPQAGRNNQGKITVRHQGGGHKRFYRFIDFKRQGKNGLLGKVKSIEYDPNRTCFISLISYQDGSYGFILTPEKLKVGDTIMSGEGENIPLQPGNSLPLKDIPVGTAIHNVELKPGKRGQLARSAGTSAEIIGHRGKYVLVRLPSKEVRMIHENCRATIGELGNKKHNLVRKGKAGRNRHRNIRPTVRGAAMNARDHPHGGGEGKAPIGHKSPLSP